MNWKIVLDSSANMLADPGVASVPLRIVMGQKEYVDDAGLDVAAFLDELGIRVVGQASDKGELQPLHKCRGETRALETIVREMTDRGFRGGRVHIDHSENADGARRLCQMLQQRFPGCEPTVGLCGGLYGYYAERGGILVGYET